jgi:pimeloyl-ACP methyl ester carboxylesterase
VHGATDLTPSPLSEQSEQMVLTDDGVMVRVVSRLAGGGLGEPPTGDRPAVVLVHGFTGSADNRAVVAQADALTAAGYPVVSLDCRGHGASGGLCTLGDLERHDVAAAAAVARTLADQVVLVGASMGGIAVLRHAAEAGDGIAGAVVVSSPASWRLPRSARAVLAAMLTQTPPGRWAARRWLGVRVAPRWTRAEEPLALAARISVPVAIVHGRRDRFIAAGEARRLRGAAAGPCRLRIVPEMGHAYDSGGIAAVVEAVEWVGARAAERATCEQVI